jgi:3-hydroxyacyl-[acyl-carrier-protein] dehydratase
MFAGHFPGNPIVPGVILTEALAQAAGIAAASGYRENEKPLFLLSAIRTMKFFQAVRPGQQVELRAEVVASNEGLVQFKVTARVENDTVAEGQLVLSVAPSRAHE